MPALLKTMASILVYIRLSAPASHIRGTHLILLWPVPSIGIIVDIAMLLIPLHTLYINIDSTCTSV